MILNGECAWYQCECLQEDGMKVISNTCGEAGDGLGVGVGPDGGVIRSR